MNRTLRHSLLLASALLLASSPALAQSVGSNLGSAMLDAVLGKSSSTSVTSGFTAAIRVLNLASLTFGTLLFCYVAVIGTLKTAEDGELLGKRWSSMWIPLRFTAVVGIMVPLASGYSAGQQGIIWLAEQGSDAASYMWSEAVGNIASGGNFAARNSSSPEYVEALDRSMRSVLAAEVCAAGYRDRYSLGSDFGLAVVSMPDGSYDAQWGWHGSADAQPWSARQCSHLQTPGYQAGTPATYSVVDPQTGLMTELSPAAPASPNASAMKALIQAQALGTQRAAAILAGVAPQLAQVCADGSATCEMPNRTASAAAREAAVKQAGDTYTATTQAALQAVYAAGADSSTLVKQSAATGWLMAGTSLFTLARAETEVQKLATWTPNIAPPSEDERTLPGVGGGDIDQLAWSDSMGGKSATDVANSPGRGLAQWLTRQLSADPEDKRHVLLQLKSSGDKIMTSMQSILAVVGIAGAWPGSSALTTVATTVAGFTPAIGGLVKAAGQGLGVGAMVLFFAGTVMSLVMPLLPFFMWVGSVVGWLIAVIQAVIATPIWLAAHLHPEGDDLTGKASQGYMILLEVTVRPMMMILGLLASLKLIDVVVRWIGYAFFATVDSIQSDSFTGFVSIVVLVIMYVGIVSTTVLTCLGLVHSIHSSVMHWIGGSSAGHDKAEEFSRAAQGQAQQGLGKAEGTVASAAGHLANRDGGGRRSARQINETPSANSVTPSRGTREED